MKHDLLNALIHISFNGLPIHSIDAGSLVNKVTDIYVRIRHYKVRNSVLSRALQVVQVHKPTPLKF